MGESVSYERLKIIIKNSGHSPLKKMGGWRKATRVAITLKNKTMPFNYWQCAKCGKRWNTPNPNQVPPQEKCPKGDFHVWMRLGRFIKWVQQLF